MMLEIGLVTLAAGLIAGFAGQRSRFCSVGGFRDFLIARDTTLLLGVVALFAAAWLTFPLVEAFETRPHRRSWSRPRASVASTHWPSRTGGGARTMAAGQACSLAAVIFVGGIGVGAVSTVTGGCPFRQHVLAGQGSRQAVFYLIGFYIAALAFGLWSPTVLRFILG